MTRAALATLSAACALAIAVATPAAEEADTKQAAEDGAVVKACLDVAVARREAAAKAEEAKDAAADGANPKAGPEAHLDEAARVAAYAPENCIGVLAGPCMQTEEGQSTYGMLACIGRESEVWDARLNAAYRERLALPAEPGTDAANNAIETKQLRIIQLAWIPWRDATCEDLYSDGIPIHGSLGKVDGAYCYMTLTARQALWMEGTLILGVEN
jgi:uncharacterized protein YecT (DUF1311 family)